MIKVRKGQAPRMLTRDEFRQRFGQMFMDPAFRPQAEALARIEVVAWQGYHESRKSPVTRKAGAGFANPDYELSVEWLATRQRLRRVCGTSEKTHDTLACPGRCRRGAQ
jgi:hypothetical protein